MIYSASYFNLGGLGDLFGGLSPQKPPLGDGTELAPQHLLLHLQSFAELYH